MGFLPIIAGIGALAQGVGSIMAGQSKAQADNYNAQVADQNAKESLTQASLDEEQFRVTARKNLGSEVAGFSAAGVRGGEGSANDVLRSGAALAEFDALKIRYGGQIKAAAYQRDSQLDIMKAGSDSAGGFLSAAGSLLGGAADVYKDIKSPTGGVGY